MSSERNGHKPESKGSDPPTRAELRGASRSSSPWGDARDALAAVHNLDALLRSNVSYKTILDILPELRASAQALAGAFEPARACSDEASTNACRYGMDKVRELGSLLDATSDRAEPRGHLAGRARSLASELEAVADLLALLERACSPVRTDVGVDVIVRESGRMVGSGRGREVVVRYAEGAPHAVVATDPHVVGLLLSLLVASVGASGLDALTIRRRLDGRRATFLVEPSARGDDALPTLTLRVMPLVPPTPAVANRIAQQMGLELELGASSGSLSLLLDTVG